MVGERRFSFLGVEHDLLSPGDWNRPGWPKLWLYNVHYFDDLVSSGASVRSEWHAALITRWITENPPFAGNGWESYPISLRVVNWMKWSLSGNELTADAKHSLAVQVRHLSRKLEFHLLGNHLWANLKALLFASAYFTGEEAEGWKKRAVRLFERELREQILQDGGHVERSPMYHSILLADLLDLIQLSSIHPGVFTPETIAGWRLVAGKMFHWLGVMTHPDGGLSFFNDAAFDIAPDLRQLEDYADRIGVGRNPSVLNPVEVLSHSGYVRVSVEDAVLLADVGDLGPAYLSGHAHADSLSFELSIRGKRVLVNGGTSTYEVSPLRQQQRGTAMHNSVVVDGVDSSEVWGSFRVARRAKVHDVVVTENPDGGVRLRAWHDGYMRLPGKVVHARTWRIAPGRLLIEDLIEGRFNEWYATFRLSSGMDIDPGGAVASDREGVTFGWAISGHASGRLVRGFWYPRFGAQLPCWVLEVSPDGSRSEVEFRWD